MSAFPDRQTTLRRPVSCTGSGLHTGEPATLELRPSGAGAGYRFYRNDIAPGLPLPALANFTVDTRNRVVLEREGVRIDTIEHLLAALYAGGVSNCDIILSGPEVPAMDGSALSFCELLDEAGTVAQEELPERIVLPAPVWVEDGERFIVALPGKGLRLTVTVDFPHPAIGVQALQLDLSADVFREELASARTFGFLKDREQYERDGLGLGANGKTALIYGESRLESGTLRYPDEAVRHKMLDLVGDLALLGKPLEARIIAYKSGHTLDLALLERIRAGLEDGFPDAGCDRSRELQRKFSRVGRHGA